MVAAEVRFARNIRLAGSPADCWIWGASRDKDGYGHFYAHGKRIRAHRYAYEMEYGPIPDGLVPDHLCRTPECVNPLHLEAVTPAVNTGRAATRGFAEWQRQKTHCPQGHPYAGDNLQIYNGGRFCRTCTNEKHRAAYAHNRSKGLSAGASRGGKR